MPWGDGTGPLGLGPMTGRRVGFCARYGTPGFLNYSGWRWWNRLRCMRFGLGWNRWFGGIRYFPFINENEEKDFLQREAEILEAELQTIKQRLDELEKKENK